MPVECSSSYPFSVPIDCGTVLAKHQDLISMDIAIVMPGTSELMWNVSGCN